ncbi:MAG: SBBP repeat-containing protein [Bacteroidetes bacterium]|nr:SBBP repeat-containing protein [Bacteroidota bacterium]
MIKQTIKVFLINKTVFSFSILLVCLVFIFINSFGQNINYDWIAQAGSNQWDHINDLEIDNDNYVYITGTYGGSFNLGDTVLTTSDGSDIFLAKYNQNGSFMWAKNIAEKGGTRGESIAFDNNNNVYVTGYFGDTAYFENDTLIVTGLGGAKDIFIVKYDQDGKFRWARSFGGENSDYSYSITVDKAANVYVTGYFIDTIFYNTDTLISNGSWDIIILKYDSSGNFKWARAAGGTQSDMGNEIIVYDEYLYLTGHFRDSALFGDTSIIALNKLWADIFVAKYDTSGKFIWVRSAGGVEWDEGVSLVLDSSQNIYVTGNFEEDPTFGDTVITTNEHDNIFIAKYDSSGKFIWVNHGYCNFTLYSSSIATDDDYIYVIGFFGGTVTFGNFSLNAVFNTDIFITKYDEYGQLIWAIQEGGDGAEWGVNLAIGNDKNLYFSADFYDTTNFGSTNLITYGILDIAIGKINSIQPSNVDPKQESFIKCFPNPSTGLFYLEIENMYEENFSMEVLNIYGQVIYSKKIRNINAVHKIDLSNYKGIYFLRINNHDYSYVYKIVVM